MHEKKCPFSQLREPDGVDGLPILGSAINMATRQLAFFPKLREKFGDIAKFKLFKKTLYLVSNPDHLREVFKEEKQGKYSKEFFTEPVKEYFGEGVLNSYGITWQVSRKRLQPYFNKNNKGKWFPIIAEETLYYLNRINLDHSRKTNAETVVVPLVQSIISRILFGVKPDSETKSGLIQSMSMVGEKSLEQAIKANFLNGILNKLPTPDNRKYKEALATIESGIKEMVSNGGDGLVHKLTEKGLSEKELRDECFTLFFAGQDTTASTIQFTLYFLAKYTVVQEKVRNEIMAQCPKPSEITMESIESMKYLEAVLNESMRLIPVAYATYRDVKEDVELGEKWIKSDSLVLLSPYVTHRHPNFWDDPNEFKPERFMSDKKFGVSYYPFGGGQRVCLGAHLARLEMTTFIAMFTASFQFTLDGNDVEKEVKALIKPKNGVPLHLKETGYLT